MSKHWGYTCLSHDPPLVSDSWLNHGRDALALVHHMERAGRWPNVPEDHPYYLAYEGTPLPVRNDITDPIGEFGGVSSNYHTQGPVEWLRQHPNCTIGLHNEYGDVVPIAPAERPWERTLSEEETHDGSK